MQGIRIFGSASRSSTAPRVRAMAKPVVGKGRDIASCRFTRTTRARTEPGNSAIVIQGSNQDEKPATPKVGTHRNQTETTITRMAAKKKFEVEAAILR